MKKVTIMMRVAVHPIQAAIWQNRGKIRLGSTLREIGKLAGTKKAAPQQIKHHLQQMVKMGAIDYVEGQYVFPDA